MTYEISDVDGDMRIKARGEVFLRSWVGPLGGALIAILIATTTLILAIGVDVDAFISLNGDGWEGWQKAAHLRRTVPAPRPLRLLRSYRHLPIYPTDEIMRLQWQPMVMPRLKMVYCYVPKAACTQLKRNVVARSSEFWNWYNFDPHDRWPEVPWYQNFPALGAENATKIMNDPTWLKWMVVRDPVERWVSAWQDKCVFEEANLACPIKGERRLDPRAVLEALKNQSRDVGPLFVEEHWRKQTLFCDYRLFRDRIHVLRFHRLKEDLAILAGAIDPVGTNATARASLLDAIDEMQPSNRTRERVTLLDPQLIADLKEWYADDYRTFDFR